MKAILRNAGFSAVAAVLDRGSMVVMTALLSSALAPAAFSRFGQFQLTLTMLAAFSGAGISASAARIFAEISVRKPTDPSLIGVMWTLSFWAAVIMGLVTIGIATFVGTDGAHGSVLLDIALFFGIVLVTCGIVANGGVLGLSMFGQSIAISGVAAAIAVGGGLLAARTQSEVIAALALVASCGATTLLSAFLVLRRVGRRTVFVRPILNWKRLRTLSGLIGPLTGVTLLAASGNWLVGHILLWMSPSSLAFPGFIIGLQWYSLTQFLPAMLTRAVFPLLVHADATTESRKVLRFSIAASLAIALCVATGIAILNSSLARFYDGRSVEGGAILAAFAFAALPQSAVSVLANALVVRNGQLAWLYLSALWFVTQLVATIALADWNAMGAAAASFIAGIVLMLATCWHARRQGIL